MKIYLGLVSCAVVLSLTGCGEDEPDEPSETVTVTSTPEATEPPTSAEPAAAFTARDLVEEAGTAGLDVCFDPEKTGFSEQRATETVTCFALSSREQNFQVFASERDQRLEISELRKTATYNANLGERDYAVPSLLAGQADDGTFWLISAPLKELTAVASALDGTVTDLSDLRTEAPKPTKKPEPDGPATSFGEGTYKVGEDVAAGLYRSGGPSPDDGRYCVVYASSKPGDLGSYLRGSTIKGPAVIELNDGEWVTAQFCETFKKS